MLKQFRKGVIMHAARERFARIRETAIRLAEEAENGKWDSAQASAQTLYNDVAFIKDWVRSQAQPLAAAQAVGGGDSWEPPVEEPLENITEPLAGTLDADLPLPR
jgi:hypothetical protein